MFYQYLAEYLGSVTIVYVMLATHNVVAFCGAYILLLILTVHLSGGFFNPMITLVIAMMNQISREEMLFYVLAQVLGGITALTIYKKYGSFSRLHP